MKLIINHQYAGADQEITQSNIRNIELSQVQSMLDMQKGWDPNAWVASLARIELEYGVSASIQELWDSRIAAREYAQAENLLIAVQDQYQEETIWSSIILFNLHFSRMITYSLLGASHQLDRLLTQTRVQLDEQRNPDGGFPISSQYLIMAFVTALEGDTDETKQLIRAWHRVASPDLAIFSIHRHISCRALGLAAASQEAVECIRTGS